MGTCGNCHHLPSASGIAHIALMFFYHSLGVLARNKLINDIPRGKRTPTFSLEFVIQCVLILGNGFIFERFRSFGRVGICSVRVIYKHSVL